MKQIDLVYEISDILRKRGITVSTAESLTGGLLASAFVDLAGSSDIFNEGYVTYSNEAKSKILGVSKDTLDKYGAVSKQVAYAMAKGAFEYSKSDIALSTTGIAGPGGGSKKKPVGTVYIGLCIGKKTYVRKYTFSGNRDDVRNKTVISALMFLGEKL